MIYSNASTTRKEAPTGTGSLCNRSIILKHLVVTEFSSAGAGNRKNEQGTRGTVVDEGG
jgi:hypothetical protein